MQLCKFIHKNLLFVTYCIQCIFYMSCIQVFNHGSPTKDNPFFSPLIVSPDIWENTVVSVESVNVTKGSRESKCVVTLVSSAMHGCRLTICRLFAVFDDNR